MAKLRLKVTCESHKGEKVATHWGLVRFNKEGVGVVSYEETEANADIVAKLTRLKWNPEPMKDGEEVEMEPDDDLAAARQVALREMDSKLMEMRTLADKIETLLGRAGMLGEMTDIEQSFKDREDTLGRAQDEMARAQNELERRDAELRAREEELAKREAALKAAPPAGESEALLAAGGGKAKAEEKSEEKPKNEKSEKSNKGSSKQ